MISSGMSASEESLLFFKYCDMSCFQPCNIFWKQSDAINSRKNFSDKVFSWEISSDGKRKYLVSDLESFWNGYQKSKNCNRNFYEVIVFSDPVKLFLDLEFPRKINEHKDSVVMTKTLITQIDVVLKKTFCIENASEGIIILESSNQAKFSIHLIYSTVIFRNIEQCGKFIQHILISSFTDQQKTMFEVKCNEKSKLFIDTEIYGKNRNLRLFLSSKFGERRPLVYVNQKYGYQELTCSKTIFLNSLITNVLETQHLSLDDEAIEKSETKNVSSVRSRSAPSCTLSSPYPKIDRKVQELAAPGEIRKITMDSQKCTVTYDIIGNKYCRTKGDFHRKNNIYFKFFIQQEKLIQDCYSPHCNNVPNIKEILID